MSIKTKIKRLLGHKNQQRIKALKGWVKYCKTRSNRGLLELQSDQWAEPVVYELPDRHLFFGYYDLQQIRGDKLLVTAVPRKAKTNKHPAKLYWIDMTTGSFHEIGESRAWCWQQGARLRWHPTLENVVMFNDVEGERYVCHMVDLEKGLLRTIPRALYDVTLDGKWGLSLNYARLQRLRPGYGYDTLPDTTAGQNVPSGDGIFLVDLETGVEKLIISYDSLVKNAPEAKNQQNYVNHISISPDGSRFLFFHLWTPALGARWSGRLYVADMDGANLRCIEDGFIPSHYCWNGSNTLLITSVGFGGSASYYYQYDLAAGTKERIDHPHLVQDGHPTYLSDGNRFLTDTYPQNGSIQRLLLWDGQGDVDALCRLYADPRLVEEKRCDLHPRLTADNQMITIDTTFQKGKRSVVLLRRK